MSTESGGPTPAPAAFPSTIKLFVAGNPVPQGSMKVIRGRMLHSNPKLAAWRKLVASQYDGPKLAGPVVIETHFVLAKPKTVKRLLPTVPPDADKLLRAIGDALQGIAYDNDSQIVTAVVSKRYGEVPGVKISLRETNV